ncbi:ACT domain-containing protein [Candidatus Soleaferrea massiliensis]|uniref:ACT domain-containing protein n=1 Tax=Candidatus Soleaferrea massiliensis TaxID=1470354 RepID=UPI00058FB770|nr:hypothetical protein [Candidatus Soleaferrea massiliensis]
MNGITELRVTDDVVLITFHNLAGNSTAIAHVLDRFAKAKLNIDMISQSAPQGGDFSLSFTAMGKDLQDILVLSGEVKKEHPQIKMMVSSGHSKILLYGEEMKELYGVASSVFTVLGGIDAEILMITTSETEISLLLMQHDVDEAETALKKAFQIA